MLHTGVEDDYKLVIFYSSFTCIYFPILLSILYFTDYLYSIGKYSFLYVVAVILVIEWTKYVIGIRVAKRKYDDRFVLGSAKKNNFKNRMKEFMKCLMVMIVMVIVYFIIAVLFGAEVFSEHEETLMFSVLLCVLTVFPACLNLGPTPVLSLVFGQKPTSDVVGTMLLRNVQITVFGAWLGAFVIPLDWDRPWQEWPIPCSLGAVGGFIAANIFMLGSVVPKITMKGSTKSRKLR